MNIKIEASRLGLPDDATEDQARAAIEARLGKASAVEAERDEWKRRALEDQAELVRLRATVNDATAKKRDIVIQAAIDAGQIAAAQKAVAEKIYDKGEDLFTEWVKSQEESAYLMTRQSLKGPFQPVAIDAELELAQVAAELQANYKDMTQAEAVREAYKRDPSLFARVTAARHKRVREKEEGGAR